jgi:hypothetical protein
MFLLRVATDLKTELGKILNGEYLMLRLLTWEAASPNVDLMNKKNK